MDQAKQINLVGKEIEVFLSDDIHDLKKVKVKNQKYIDDKLIIVTNEGEIYSEDDINFTYTATPEAVIWMLLMEYGIIPEDYDSFDFDTYHEMFIDLMNNFVNIGILSKSENEYEEYIDECGDECGDDECYDDENLCDDDEEPEDYSPDDCDCDDDDNYEDLDGNCDMCRKDLD